jgi:hypothetical protein
MGRAAMSARTAVQAMRSLRPTGPVPAAMSSSMAIPGLLTFHGYGRAPTLEVCQERAAWTRRDDHVASVAPGGAIGDSVGLPAYAILVWGPDLSRVCGTDGK